MRCAICYHLYNLKNVKNTHGGVLNCTNGTESRNASHIFRVNNLMKVLRQNVISGKLCPDLMLDYSFGISCMGLNDLMLHSVKTLLFYLGLLFFCFLNTFTLGASDFICSVSSVGFVSPFYFFGCGLYCFFN